MRAAQIKVIPKDVRIEIARKDVSVLAEKYGRNITRYYAYFDTLKNGEILKITVAVKTDKKTNKLILKQVAARNLEGKAFARDMTFYYIGGYQVDFECESEWQACDPKFFNPFAYQICLDRLDKTPYKYSGYKQCAEQGFDVQEYLKIWTEYPRVEMLMKAGLGWLAMKKSIVKRCESDKQFLKFIKNNIDTLKSERPSMPMILSAYKNNLTIYQAKILHDFIHSKKKKEPVKEVMSVIPKSEVFKFIEYIDKNNINIWSYADYIRACIDLGVDMQDTKNKYPKDFSKWHEIRVNQYYSKNKTKAVVEGMLDVFCKYKNLQYTGGYAVYIAKSKNELENEGEYLHHCVGRMDYDVKMIKEQSLIFFVRNIENPHVPFVTLEYSLQSKKVKQCYGDHDSKPSLDVLDFVYNKWQPYATRKLSAIKRKIA